MTPKYDHKVKRPRPWVRASETDITKTWDMARKMFEEEQRKREEDRKAVDAKLTILRKA